MKKTFRVLFIVVIAIALIICGCIAYLKLPVSAYYKASTKTINIPDIYSGFIPQGISYNKTDNDFYITGYMKDGSASPVYIVDARSYGLKKKVLLALSEEKPYNGHAGGLSVYKGNLYVAGGEDACLYVFSLDDIARAADNSYVESCDRINLATGNDDIRVSFTAVNDGMLYAGEFYRYDNYLTQDSHTVDTADGQNKAFMVGMTIDGNKPDIKCVYSLPDLVQGACFDDGSLYVSCSWGVSFSHIYRYDLKSLSSDSNVNVLGKDIPLYVLDSECLAKDTKIAPMSEEIEILDGKLYVMCESASNKYIFGRLTAASKVLAADIELFD